MKKYFIPMPPPPTFGAIKFTGSFDDIDNDANAAHEGSGESFDEDETEKGKTLLFTDANGEAQRAVPGDYLKETFDTDGTTFKGWSLVTATDAANWQEATAE